MTADSELKLLPGRAVGFQSPAVLRILAAQDVAFTIAEQNSKIGRAGRVPAVFHLRDVHHFAAELQPHRAFVALIAGVAFHVQKFLSQSPALLCGSPPALHSTPRLEK